MSIYKCTTIVVTTCKEKAIILFLFKSIKPCEIMSFLLAALMAWMCHLPLKVPSTHMMQAWLWVQYWKLKAISEFDMAIYTKIFLKFPKGFWRTGKGTEFFLYADGSRGYYPIWQVGFVKFLSCILDAFPFLFCNPNAYKFPIFTRGWSRHARWVKPTL